MSTQPSANAASELAGGEPGAVAAGSRNSVFALPVSTSFRFALLIAAVVASSIFVYSGIYMATPRGAAWLSLARTCLSKALPGRPSGWSGYARGLEKAAACRSGAEHAQALWVLLGIGVLVVLAGAIYWAQPWWYRRRMHLDPLTGQDAPALMSRLEELRRRAGTGPVIWLLQPFNLHLSAFAFGNFRRRFIAVSGGAAVASVRQPAAFEAVILHELAHVRNRDINQTYLAVAIWRAFVVAALLPMAGLLVFGRDLSPDAVQRLLWRVAVLALTVYLLRNSIVRSREFDADARVAELDPGTSLGRVLAGQPPRRGRRVWHLGWLHPSGQERAAALQNPVPLFRCGFWAGLAMGLVAAIGAAAAKEIVPLLSTENSLASLIPAAIFALFSGVALAIAMWRRQLLQPEAATASGWASGLGLGARGAACPIIALPTALDQGVAPDSLRLAALGVLVVWIALTILIFMPFPVWIGYWADAWQKRTAMTGPRVPARGGMLAAAIAAWAVLAVGLDLLLTSFTFVEQLGSDPGSWHSLAQVWTFAGVYIAQQPGSLVVCLATVGVALLAPLANRWRRRPDTAQGAALPYRRAGRAAAVCLAGGLTAAAVTLAISATAHARITAPVRWSGSFLPRLIYFDEQAVVAVAVVVALIVAAKARSAQAVASAVGAAAVSAGLGALAVVNAGTIGTCIAPLSIQYTHPPASHCPSFPGGSFVVQQVHVLAIGAALVSILFIPAAHRVGCGLAGLRARRMRSAGRAVTLRWAGMGAAVIAVMTGIALWGPEASAHGVKPMGSIGRDGWIRGAGYEFRLRPDWYELTQPGNPEIARFVYSVDGAAEIVVESGPAQKTTAAFTATLLVEKLTRERVHAARIDGAQGLSVTGTGADGYVYEEWLLYHGATGYIVAFTAVAADSASPQDDLAKMMHSWQWNTSTPTVSGSSPLPSSPRQQTSPANDLVSLAPAAAQYPDAARSSR